MPYSTVNKVNSWVKSQDWKKRNTSASKIAGAVRRVGAKLKQLDRQTKRIISGLTPRKHPLSKYRRRK